MIIWKKRKNLRNGVLWVSLGTIGVAILGPLGAIPSIIGIVRTTGDKRIEFEDLEKDVQQLIFEWEKTKTSKDNGISIKYNNSTYIVYDE